MAYFSNHSQSRFNSNSQQPTASNSIPQQPIINSNRTPISKHFSTSVSKESVTASVHPLRNTWVCYFRQQKGPARTTNYEESVKKISAFSSVESFWSLWTHLAPPSALQPTTDYLLFHSGVRRPVWEDPLNLTGGKWIIRLKKGVADRVWEDLVLALIGDCFDDDNSWEDNSDAGSDWPEICGCTISVRQSEDIVSVWNRVDDSKVREKIRDTIRKVLNLSPSTIMEYKSNNDSIQDKSSFRNSAIDRAPV